MFKCVLQPFVNTKLYGTSTFNVICILARMLNNVSSATFFNVFLLMENSLADNSVAKKLVLLKTQLS